MEPLWTRCYERHFARHFGKPFDVERFRNDDGLTLRLATHDLRYKEFRIYASLGMAEEVSKDIGEVILLSDDFSKDVPFLLVNSLFFILQNDIPLGARFAVGGVDLLRPDFAEYYDKVAIYYTLADGFEPGFETVDCEGEIGKVYQGLFISYNELDFLRRIGPDAFEARYKTQQAELCSLRRPSCV